MKTSCDVTLMFFSIILRGFSTPEIVGLDFLKIQTVKLEAVSFLFGPFQGCFLQFVLKTCSHSSTPWFSLNESVKFFPRVGVESLKSGSVHLLRSWRLKHSKCQWQQKRPRWSFDGAPCMRVPTEGSHLSHELMWAGFGISWFSCDLSWAWLPEAGETTTADGSYMTLASVPNRTNGNVYFRNLFTRREVIGWNRKFMFEMFAFIWSATATCGYWFLGLCYNLAILHMIPPYLSTSFFSSSLSFLLLPPSVLSLICISPHDVLGLFHWMRRWC